VIILLKIDDLVLDNRASGEWCRLSYIDHPKGCPNYGKKKKCPPYAKPFEDLIEPPYYIIVQEFDLEAQMKRMKKCHPDWTDRQCRNPRYWQGGVVKKLREEAYNFVESHPEENLMVLEIPEANGVHVFKTCRNIGITLDRNPQKIVRKVMIIGKKKV